VVPLLANISLEKRIPLFAGIALVVILTTFTLVGLQAVNDSREQALQERLVSAKMIASHLDLTLSHVLRMLGVTSDLLTPALEQNDLVRAGEILNNAYEQLGIFKHNLFLLDRDGSVLLIVSGPASLCVGSNISGQPFISQAMRSSGPLVAEQQCYLSDGTSIVCVASPIKDSAGEIIGLVAGSVDIADPGIGGFVNTFRLGETGYAQIVDASGAVLANTPRDMPAGEIDHQGRLAGLIEAKEAVVAGCHNCHKTEDAVERQRDILAFAPLNAAKWGVTIRQSEKEVFAQARDLQRKFGYLAILSILAVVVLVWTFTRSITSPLSSITLAAERMASGNLSHGVSFASKDEIGRLSRAFERMRIQLKTYLDQISEWNKQLEERVRQRTVALEESRAEITGLYEELRNKEQVRRELLGRIISVQEEERKRIARELHDETSQALTALAVGLDTAVGPASAEIGEVKRRIEGLRPLLIETLEEVHNLIFDLRPSSLDDLGLVAALQSYAESRLEGIGIKVNFQSDSLEQRLPAHAESALFRIVQEAMTNVVKHAEADNVTVSLRFADEDICATVTDDGRGFDTTQVLGTNGGRHGFGLLGISERVSLLGGQFSVDSAPGQGTRIDVRIPLDEKGNGYGRDKGSAG